MDIIQEMRLLIERIEQKRPRSIKEAVDDAQYNRVLTSMYDQACRDIGLNNPPKLIPFSPHNDPDGLHSAAFNETKNEIAFPMTLRDMHVFVGWLQRDKDLKNVTWDWPEYILFHEMGHALQKQNGMEKTSRMKNNETLAKFFELRMLSILKNPMKLEKLYNDIKENNLELYVEMIKIVWNNETAFLKTLIEIDGYLKIKDTYEIPPDAKKLNLEEIIKNNLISSNHTDEEQHVIDKKYRNLPAEKHADAVADYLLERWKTFSTELTIG